MFSVTQIIRFSLKHHKYIFMTYWTEMVWAAQIWHLGNVPCMCQFFSLLKWHHKLENLLPRQPIKEHRVSLLFITNEHDQLLKKYQRWYSEIRKPFYIFWTQTYILNTFIYPKKMALSLDEMYQSTTSFRIFVQYLKELPGHKSQL